MLIVTLSLLNGITPNTANGLFFGDATGFTNALAEISSYSFTQGTNLDQTIPEPSSTLGLISLGFLGLATVLKRKI